MRRTGFFSISLPVLTFVGGILRGGRGIVNARAAATAGVDLPTSQSVWLSHSADPASQLSI